MVLCREMLRVYLCIRGACFKYFTPRASREAVKRRTLESGITGQVTRMSESSTRVNDKETGVAVPISGDKIILGETFTEKFKRKFKAQPLVPIGT